MGPAASQVAIKQTGTNGGGYMGVNSAHPLENSNAFTNLIEMISILLIPAALCFTFGSAVKNKRQGIAIFMAMFLCLVVTLSCIAVTEQVGTSQLAQNGAVNMSMAEQAGGNMEGITISLLYQGLKVFLKKLLNQLPRAIKTQFRDRKSVV